MITRASTVGLLAALAACAAPPERAAIDEAVPDAGDVASGPRLEAIDVASCTDCHDSVTREWRASAHHAAFTNDVFQNEWLLHGDPWCVRCHAPETDANAPSGRGATDGVSCASCHVVSGEIVSSHASPGAPHAVRVDPSFATETQCARCHNVKFPPAGALHGARVAPGQVLQRTITEWRDAQTPGACQSCHMPDVAGAHEHRSHLFPGGRDPTLLSQALRVSADARCEGGTTRVHLALEAGDVGHAVPTGDVFRRLEVHATLDGRASSLRTAALYRRFTLGPDHLLRETRDDRVPARGTRDVVLELPGCGRRVAWSVDWLALDGDVADQRALSSDDVRREAARGVTSVEAP